MVLEDDTTIVLDRPDDADRAEPVAVVDWSAGSVQGRAREENQDRWSHHGVVFAVADGMGGLSNGGLAATEAINLVVDGWSEAPDRSPRALVAEASRSVRARCHHRGDHAGSTLSAVCVGRSRATVAHVGDSLVFRVRDERALRVTSAHTLYADMLASGLAPRAGSDRLRTSSLTSYLGMPDDRLRIEVRSIAVRPGDRIVLCTDGISSVESLGAMVERAGHGTVAAAVRRLLADYGSDDATAMVLDIGPASV